MLSLRRLAAITFAATLILALTGCGLGDPAPAGDYVIGNIVGSAYGGGIPIYKGRVRLWITSSATAGYGTSATEVTSGQTIQTDAYGGFTIANSGANAYTCTSGEFAYITVSGGDAGGGTLYGGVYTANNNSVQMAAIGSCSHLSSQSAQSATRIYISELSTVAAAYALSNFIAEDPSHLSDGDQRVWVNAPSSNNAATGSCSTTSNVTTSCTGSGLAKAFDNAANLVHVVCFACSTTPSGTANYTLDGTNSVGTNTNATVPQALLNTLADIIEGCVNTNGGSATSGTANDGSACGKLFSYTTYSTNTPPADTLAALVSLAHHPNGYTTTSVANLFALMPKTGAGFTPLLATAPSDYSMMIVYNGYSGSAFNAVQSDTLDAAGNIYFDDSVASTSDIYYSLSPNGTQRWTATVANTNPSPQQMATDTLGTAGQVWLVNGANTNGKRFIYCYTAAGAACSSPASVTMLPAGQVIAIDRANNIWSGRQGTAISLYEFQQSNSYTQTATTISLGVVASSIAIDQGQNIWIAGATASGTATVYNYLADTSATTTPSYSFTSAPSNSTLPNTSGATVAYGTQGISVDNAYKIYFANHSTFSSLLPGEDTNHHVTSGGTPVTVTSTGASPGQSEVDGSGLTWYGGTTSTIYGANASGTIQGISPCQLASQATTCAVMLKTPQSTVIDDAGTMWVAYSTASFTGVGQIIGTASPVWSQLSYGNPGICPGNSSVYSFGCK